jgi:hypothetical protein
VKTFGVMDIDGIITWRFEDQIGPLRASPLLPCATAKWRPAVTHSSPKVDSLSERHYQVVKRDSQLANKINKRDSTLATTEYVT